MSGCLNQLIPVRHLPAYVLDVFIICGTLDPQVIGVLSNHLINYIYHICSLSCVLEQALGDHWTNLSVWLGKIKVFLPSSHAPTTGDFVRDL